MGIALKEAEETDYWLYLLIKSEFIDEKTYDSMQKDVIEIVRILMAIIKSARENK